MHCLRDRCTYHYMSPIACMHADFGALGVFGSFVASSTILLVLHTVSVWTAAYPFHPAFSVHPGEFFVTSTV